MFSFLKRLLGFHNPRPTSRSATVRRRALCVDALEERAVPADLAVLSARLDAPDVVGFDFQAEGISGPFQAAVFRSADPVLDPSDFPVSSTQSITPNPTSGMQHGQVALLGELPIDPARPHVIVAVDPANTLAESDESNNVASFRKLTLGVTVHGLALSGQKPAWIDQAGDLLERQGYAGTIRFDWAQASRLPVPGQGVMAGLRLADLIRQQAAQLATQPNDVIDVHLIGHSRGNTVITTALFALQAQPGPQALALGFAKLTLLDPHVARNQGALARGLAELRNRSGVSTVGLFSFAARSPQSRAVAEATLRFQAAAQDPPVVIAPNADAVEVFFQRLPWNRTISLDRLVGLNLWAEAPEAIINLSARPALFLNVSPFAIGHINVPDLYLALLSR